MEEAKISVYDHGYLYGDGIFEGFFFSSRRRHTRSLCDWSSDVCSSDLAAQRREVAALVAQPDDKIDYSDIPPLTERFWENAVRNPFYRPVKQQLTLRLDADVIAWLRRPGVG